MRFLKGHWQLFALTGLVFLLWNTPLVFPLKVLVIFLHELSHGLAALLTGGSIEQISISARLGGHALTRGGNVFLILSAGYVGSLILGALVLLLALRTHADRAVMAIFGAVLLAVTAVYIRDGFAVLFCVAAGLGMLATARFLGRDLNDLLLRIIGLTSLIYVPHDIFSDTIARSNLRSDAFMIAERFGGSTVFWGGLWLAISLAAILLCLRYGIGQSSNIQLRRVAR